jgi:hypothetical protein
VCGALVDYYVGDLEVNGLSPASVVQFSAGMAHQTLDYDCAVFREALPHICVKAGA